MSAPDGRQPATGQPLDEGEYVAAGPPRRFTFRARLRLSHRLGHALIAGAAATYLAVPVSFIMGAAFAATRVIPGWVAPIVIVPLAWIGFVWLLPFWDETARCTQWFAGDREACRAGGFDCFIVQVALDPPVVTGLAKLLDDADDVGLLLFEPDHLRFEGDAVRMRIAFDNIAMVMTGRSWRRGVGLRSQTFCVQLKRAVGGAYRLTFLVREGRSQRDVKRATEALGARLLALGEAR